MIFFILFIAWAIISIAGAYLYGKKHKTKTIKRNLSYVERHKIYNVLNSCKTLQQLGASLNWALKIIYDRKKLNKYNSDEYNELDNLRERVYDIYYSKLKKIIDENDKKTLGQIL